MKTKDIIIFAIGFFVLGFICGILIVQTISIHESWHQGKLIDGSTLRNIPFEIYIYIGLIGGMIQIVNYGLIYETIRKAGV